MLSLETCQKLKAAGWPQDDQLLIAIARGLEAPIVVSEYSWYASPDDTTHEVFNTGEEPEDFEYIATCPTLEELLEAISAITPNFQIESGKGGDGQYWIRAWAEPVNPVLPNADAVGNNMVEVAAVLWLKLKGAK